MHQVCRKAPRNSPVPANRARRCPHLSSVRVLPTHPRQRVPFSWYIPLLKGGILLPVFLLRINISKLEEEHKRGPLAPLIVIAGWNFALCPSVQYAAYGVLL